MNIGGSEAHIDIYDNRMEIYSLGGMPDDSMIQERDSLTVSSARRNLILVYCILKIPTIAEGNPESCMRNFPIIADAFGISLSPQQML